MKFVISLVLFLLLPLHYLKANGSKPDSMHLAVTEVSDKVDQFLHPYASSSAFNRLIGTEATYADSNSATTIDIRKVPKWGLNTKNGWSTAVAVSGASDPLITVTCSSTNPNRNINFPYTMHIPMGFPLSSGVQAETNDGRIVVYDQTTSSIHEFYKFKWNNGNPTADIHYTDDIHVAVNSAHPTPIRITADQHIIHGKGHGSSSEKAGTRASGTTGLAGLLRAFEVTEPNLYPQHALALELSFEQLSKAFQWPACSVDFTAPTENKGRINYGTLFAIPPKGKGGPDIETLGLSEAGKRIAKTLVVYGAYVVDRRGKNAGISGDQYIPDSIRQDIEKDLRTILIPYLREVTNNQENQAFSGGGKALKLKTGGKISKQ